MRKSGINVQKSIRDKRSETKNVSSKNIKFKIRLFL